MVVRISGDGSISGLTDWEATSVTHPDSADTNIVLADDGSVAFDSIPADIQAAIDGAGGLVAVKHVLKTNTFVSGSIGTGGSVDVTDLEIVHEVADPANRLIISAYFGVAGNVGGRGETGIAIAVDGTPIAIGDAEGSRTRVGAGARMNDSNDGAVAAIPSVTFVYTPGAGEKTYTVRAINFSGNGAVYINRTRDDTNNGFYPRGTSALFIQEVKV